VDNHYAEGRKAAQWSYSRLKCLSDEDLFDALANGSHDALVVLFDRYHRLVLSITSNLLRDPAEAEDLLQTVFLEIYQTARAFDRSKGTAKAWIVRYAYHRSLNRRAYLALRGFYDRGDELKSRPAVCEQAAIVRHDGQEWNAFELKRLLEQGLNAITADQRITLYLSFFEGLSMTDIAERLGEKLSNVRHHYYRGLMRLRLFIEGRFSDAQTGGRPKGKSSYAKP